VLDSAQLISLRLLRIKGEKFFKEFTKRARDVVEKMVGTAHPTASRVKHGEGRIWQRRFWEHQIRDQNDYNAHVDYIHYNLVKHGLA